MMNRLFLVLTLLLAGEAVAAPLVRVKKDPATKTVSFFIDGKEQPGVLTLYFELREVSNCATSPGIYKYEVLQNGATFLKLRPEDESRGVGYGYTVRYFYGRVDPSVDTTLICRVPCTTMRPVRVIRTRNILDFGLPEGQQRPLGYSFLLEKGDTVYAMRRGVVVLIQRPEAPAGEDPSLSFSTRRTNLVVEHPDGSESRYGCLSDRDLFAEVGDEVLPGTPLGLVGSYDGEQYKVSVIVYRRGFAPQADVMRDALQTCYFDPHFATDAGAVVPESGVSLRGVMNDGLLMREMSKREQKRWRAMHR